MLGLDIGTGSVKAVALSEQGKIIWSSQRELPSLLMDNGRVEFDADVWFNTVAELVREFSSHFKPTFLRMCIGGQAPSIVPVSSDGEPLARAIVWMDGRAVKEAERLRKTFGEEVDAFTAESKLLWIKENMPTLYQKTRYFLHCFDYVSFRLTGVASVGILDEGYFTWESIPYWVPSHLEAMGFDVSKLPEPRLIGNEIGIIKPEMADLLKIPRGTVVVQGTVDFAQSILGVGVVEPGLAMDHGGTSQGFDLCWDKKLEPKSREFNCVKHVVKGYWNVSGVMNTTGAVYRWFKNNFYPADAKYSLVDAEAAASEPCRLIVLPYFQGERTPIWNPYARGVFFGLTLKHSRGDLARAILEATAFGLRRIKDAIENAGGKTSEIRVAGGQAKSDVWNQIKADVLGVRIVKTQMDECSPLGAALLASVSEGLYRDLKYAASKVVKIEKVYEPDLRHKELYDHFYELYIDLYDSVKKLFPRFIF